MSISISGNGLWPGGMMGYGASKSAREKQQRKAQCDSQVAILEQQKKNLKNRECDTLEEIGEKLKMFHSYEDQIAAVKKAYNNAQMWHMMDEAREQGEKIAKAVEKMEPKTAEERRKEAAQKAAGTEEEKGVLTEILEEMEEITKNSGEAEYGNTLEDAKALESTAAPEDAEKLKDLEKQHR